jgi:hypothetical protein
MGIIGRTVFVRVHVKFTVSFPFVNAGNSHEVVWLLITVAAAVRCGKHKISFHADAFYDLLG